MSKTAFLFSGQGSQYTGMGDELCKISKSAKNVFSCASDVLGFDLLKVCQEADEKTLAQTSNAQPAIMAVSLAAFYAMKERGFSPDAVAGHSLGEYGALVASDSISLEDGFKVIKARAKAMQECSSKGGGMMCAVLGTTAEKIEQVCSTVEGYVTPVNYNSPAQTVIAGETGAVEEAMEKLKGIARRCAPLKVSAAFHSKLMAPAAQAFSEDLKEFSFSFPSVPFYSNLTGSLLSEQDDIKQMLVSHLVSPVKFASELNNMQKDGIDVFVELGPNKVLTGLVKKTLKDITALQVENEKTLDAACEKLSEVL